MFDFIYRHTGRCREQEQKIQELEHKLEEATMCLAYMISEPQVVHKDTVTNGRYIVAEDKELRNYQGYEIKKKPIHFPAFVYKIWVERKIK